MLYYLLFCTILGFIFRFYIIFGTNLLTGDPAQNCCFLPVLGFRRKGISNGVQTEWNLRERDFLTEHDPRDLDPTSRNKGGGHEVGGAPPPSWTGCGPPGLHLWRGFLLFFLRCSVEFQVIPRIFVFCTENNTMAILLKISSVRVSSVQIIQVRVQNKGKSVWKSRYDGDVSTPPSLNLCLSSSNSVDKLKVIKKNFYKLCLLLLL